MKPIEIFVAFLYYKIDSLAFNLKFIRNKFFAIVPLGSRNFKVCHLKFCIVRFEKRFHGWVDVGIDVVRVIIAGLY